MHNGVFLDSFGFSLYIIIYSVYLMFSMNEEFDFFPSNYTSFLFFLALLHLQELTIQCCIEIERMGLFALSFILRGKIQSLIIKCSVS